MAENEQPPSEPDRDDQPAGPIDPEQFRQFQEFQRFQQFLAYSEQRSGQRSTDRPGTEVQPWAQPPSQVPAAPSTPPPVAPNTPQPQVDQPALHEQLAGVREQLAELTASQARVERTVNPPLWKKILGNKWLHRAIALLIVIGLASWAYRHFFGSADDNNAQSGQPKSTQQARQVEGADGAKQAVADVYIAAANIHEALADGDSADADQSANQACLEFDDNTVKQFAADLHASGCAQALEHLAITDPDAYRSVELRGLPEPTGAIATISSCSFDVTGGPRLGTFTVSKQSTGKWIVTGHRNETCGATDSAAPPS